MRRLNRLRMKMRMLFGRGAAGARLDDELEFHLEQQIAENVAAGMSADEARFAALRSFGNPGLLREQTRATWGWAWIESVVRDARSVARAMGRRPGFALTVVGTLALGIGAAAAMFTVVDHVLLRPLPYRDAASLVMMQETDGTIRNWESPWVDIEQWRAQSHSFSAIEYSAQMVGRNFLEGPDAALEVTGQRVSPGLFGMLGVEPALGRSFHAGSDNSAGSILLSDTVWKEVFAGDRTLVGKAVRINDASYTVAGVMPPGFSYPAGISLTPQVWIPAQLSEVERTREFKAMQFIAMARLRPGSTVESARAEMLLVQKRLAAQYTDDVLRHDHASTHVDLYAETLVGKDVRKALLALLAASGVLWLIASLNATNLFLARNTSRLRESAMRMALGASRWRLMQRTLVEGLMLSALAVVLGVGLAVGSVQLLAHELSQTLPVPAPATPDDWILLALVGLTVLTTLVATAGPALLAGRTSVGPALKQGSAQAGSTRQQHRMRGVLVASEIALSLTLIATCGLLLRTIYTLRHVPLGFRTDHIVVAHLSIPSYRFAGQNMTETMYLPLLDRVQHLHGVESAGLMNEVPLGKTFVVHLELAMKGQKTTHAFMKAVSPDLQRVFGFRMAAGRFFGPQDTATSQPVIVVNKAYALEHSPDPHNPLAILGSNLLSLRKGFPQMRIIGVIDDERQDKIAEPAVPEVELALPQITPESGYYPIMETVAMDLAVRTERPAHTFIPELRAFIKQASPEFQGATITTMDQIVADSYGSQRLAAHLLEIFGGCALVLCMAGLYGLLAYVVSQRTRELGVRIALGASRGALLWMVIRQAGGMLLAGVAVGMGLALASGKLVSRFLYGVSAHDGWTMIAAPVLLLAVGLVAAYVPARRAASVDPMEALRSE
ncbi:MAG TPA: ABC transporter permease [Terracidiphilus sp.]|nr:ABC transporter permease [Terracidiphilus sp.]